MTPEESTPDVPKEEKKNGKKQMALERMRLALEKLQLARVKITITFIALGFTSYRFFNSRMEDGKAPLLDFITGRDIGMFLIFVGTVGLTLATYQHIKSLAKLKIKYEGMYFSVSLLTSYFILLLSFVLLAVVIFKL